MEKYKENSHDGRGTANAFIPDNILSGLIAHRIIFLTKEYFNG
jgi:hypothetical protein